MWLAGVIACALAVAVTLLGMGHGYPTVRFALHPGAAWVSSNQTGQLTLIDGPSARATASSSVADTSTVIGQLKVAPPGSHLTIVQQGANAFAINQAAGSITRIDGARIVPSAGPNLVAGVAVAGAADYLSGFVAGDVLYILDERHGLLSVVDSRSLNALGPRLSVAGVTATNTAVTAGRLWALDSQSGNLVSFSATTKHVSVHVATPGHGLLTIADGQPIVLDTAQNKLTLISASSGRPQQSIDVDLRQGDQIMLSGAPADRSVFLVVASRGVLIVCGFSKRSCLDPVQLGSTSAHYGAAVTATGHVFVPNYSMGRVTDIDLDTLNPVQASLFDNQTKTFDLFARDGYVFYNDPNGNRAGVIDADGTVHRLAKYVQTKPTGGHNSVPASGGQPPKSPSAAIVTTTPSTKPGQPQSTPAWTPPPPVITPQVTPGAPPPTTAPPLAFQIELTVSPNSPLVGDSVEFAARISGGTPTQWAWTVTSSSGGPVEASAPTPTLTHIFRSAGTYRVTLTVSRGSTTATKSGSVTVRTQPVQVHCGDTITSSVTLTNDLTCQGNGLIIGANNLTIDLNGHRISGASAGTGIQISPDLPSSGLQLTVRNGAVRDFATAIDVENNGGNTNGLLTLRNLTLASNALGLGTSWLGLTAAISGSSFQANTTGIGANSTVSGFLGTLNAVSSSFSTNVTAINLKSNSRSISVDNSVFTGNGTGLRAHNGSVSVTNSRFINNPQAIVTNQDAAVITGNVIQGSSQVGLDISDDYYFLSVTGNTITGSGIGIRVIGTTDGSSRTVANNAISGNGSAGIFVYLNGGGMTLKANTVRNNGFAPGGYTDPGGKPLIDGIWTNTVPNRSATIEIAGNTAADNAGYGIAAYQATDGGGNIAHGNGNPAQCIGVRYTA
ncbi:MAG: right-handed parallel beta-helix repeat-containing protein [Actinomycetota bacterium]|nr:right-handed parallel beta-helix repeat-containing protein [Actinomycetota bacterium]